MPVCATECYESSITTQTTCTPANVTCICVDQKYLDTTNKCIQSSCTIRESLVAQNITATLCGRPIRDRTGISPIITGVSGGAALFSVAARCYIVGKGFALNDFFAVLAFISAIPLGVMQFLKSDAGNGKDTWTVTPENITLIMKYTWIAELSYSLVLPLTKMSFVACCLRIFPSSSFRWRANIVMALCVAYGVVFTVITTFKCTPIDYTWTSWDGQHKGTCIDFHVFAASAAAVNITIEIMVLALPIPELLKLAMSLRSKLYIIAMFSVGVFTLIVAIIRLKSLVLFDNSPNPTWDDVPTAYWSTLEAFVGIFCICMPALRRFLILTFPRFFASTQQNSRYNLYEDGPALPNRISQAPPKDSKPISLASGGRFGLETEVRTTVVETPGESRENLKEDDDDERVMLADMGSAKREGKIVWG
ncbi:hypothetical protein COCC4DRAFT_70612 [Bipolaris maydis ATCC 48331]|uniref:CFEM domain-containing protein n=2 Tax=Cochliobolus heterostrophus TaxID=5016 RepID=N4XLA2_COCH4|nr:uncharacterized protein COCC4DRAFT_70612 [Bipolaris maydis ATCC 48331]KAJ5027722.1 hypothetical protein J3E73DRAFT_380297 [Bipolaris maydis]ENI07151.1 hypothetical protein COCC4DRAFT_70612 [Bipolaris maydis ATCC 48331]KAJ5062477.1 hypothetical protein J3E74DRAFT_239059 [Bipolaris maydis]KAJ6204652.1 hypothetical protein PSV09DRAFT_2226975 [Bipolaris maydis]KAJ6266638.1 hypothetical protein PSV08DRAFT_365789 [Bipolaris maydis]